MDLLLRAKGNQQPIEVVLVGGGAPVCFSVPWPDQVIQQHQAWRHRYLTYNDPTAAAVSADAVAMRGNALIAGMQSWFADPAWRPLDQQRQLQAKTTPLRISFEGASTALQTLPWELLQWGQPIWRTEQQQHLVQRRRQLLEHSGMGSRSVSQHLHQHCGWCTRLRARIPTARHCW